MAGLHTDVPTTGQVDQLMRSNAPACVSIYVPTDPVSDNRAAAVDLRNLLGDAVRQLDAAGLSGRTIAAVEERIDDLVDDEDFWRFQARCLAVFADPERIVTFRLPNRLTRMVAVSDRMHLKPLLRSITFPQSAFVLALALGSVRLLEVLPDSDPFEVDVPNLPTDVASAARKSSIKDRSPARRLHGSEGQKVRMRQYARKIDRALRDALPFAGVPLILAGTEPLLSIFRSVCTYPSLAEQSIAGSPERRGADALVSAARDVLDGINDNRVRDLRNLFESRTAQGRTATDVAEVAWLATQGAVDTVFVDIDATLPGDVEAETGAVRFAETDQATTYGVVDEIARRVWLANGQVAAVRRDEIPGHGDLAAILRYTTAS
jgi:Bacterial archaeo-eukaryotic release factor family 11